MNTSVTCEEQSDGYLMEDGNAGDHFENSANKLRTTADFQF